MSLMAPGIRPADPGNKGGEGSATGPPATASGAPPAYKDQRSLAGGGAALSRRGVLQPVAPTVWETVVGTRTLLASQRPSYLGRRRVAGAGRPGGSATPVRTRTRCRNGVRSWWPGGYRMPPHADDYLHLTQLVSLSGCTRGRRYWRVPEVLQCIGVNGGSRFLLACLPRCVRQSSGLPPLPLVPRVTFVLPPTAPSVKCVFLGVAT